MGFLIVSSFLFILAYSKTLTTLNHAKIEMMHEPQDGQPPIADFVALTIATCFAVGYVAPFYLVSSLRISQSVSRNSPTSIQARSRAVFLVCVLCFVVCVNIQAVVGPATQLEILRRAGIYPFYLQDIFKCIALLCVLFAGPLYEQGLVEGGWRSWFRWQSVREELWDDWIGWRNLFVGPVSEEFIFRSMNVSLLLSGWIYPTKIIWQAPLIFGVAHLHHFNEYIIMHRRSGQSYFSALVTPGIIMPGLLRTVFQFAFTSLFGAFVTFVFLRTGNLYACILAHTFCNWLGFPRVWGRVGQDLGEEAARRSDEQELDDLARNGMATTTLGVANARGQKALGLQWTVIYYLLLVGGAYGFSKLLWPLTESDNQLVYV